MTHDYSAFEAPQDERGAGDNSLARLQEVAQEQVDAEALVAALSLIHI